MTGEAPPPLRASRGARPPGRRLPVGRAIARALVGGWSAAIYGLLMVSAILAPVMAAIEEASKAEVWSVGGFVSRLPSGFVIVLTTAFFLGFVIAAVIGPLVWFFADRKARVSTRNGAWIGAIVGGLAGGFLAVFAIFSALAGAAAGALAALTVNKLLPG